jgi:hypothetical protein
MCTYVSVTTVESNGLDCNSQVRSVNKKSQCSKWKFRSAGIILKSETKIYRQKNEKWIYYAIVSASMKFRNKNKFRYVIPAYTGQFRAMRLVRR